MKIRRNDTVKIIAGKDRGSVGKVLSVVKDGQRVVVEGLNLVKRHTRANATNRTGGIIEKPAPIHVSNVALVTPDGNPTRVGYRFEATDAADGGKPRKVRYSRKFDRVLD